MHICYANDDGSFALWDRRLSRLTVIDAASQLVRTENFITGEPAPTAFSIFSDGALLATYPTRFGHLRPALCERTRSHDRRREWER